MTQLRRQHDSSWLLSGLACAAVTCFFLCTDQPRNGGPLWHWFVLPVFLCGVLMFEDVVRWLRGDVDVFDPIGVVGAFGLHFFFLAPLLHVRWDYWMDVVPPPPDWRPWLGGMAVLNLVGLLIYRFVRSLFPAAEDTDPAGQRSGWRLRPHRLRWALAAALPLAAALQMMVYARYGGIGGYIQAFEEGRHTFLGVSRIGVASHSFPILLLIGYIMLVHWQRRTPTAAELLLVAFSFLVLKMLFGGLHGSRANVVIAAFWAVGMTHLCLRKLPRRLCLACATGLLAFIYIYGFYKSAGISGLKESLQSSAARTRLAAEVHRPITGTLLGDLGRSDVQAYVLFRLLKRDSDFQYGLGRTYYGALITLVPGPLWRNRPPTKVKEGTEALYGRNTYRVRELTATQAKDRYVGQTSKVFGLAGETMLNFGPLAVPFAFTLLGVVVGWTHQCMCSWNRRDPRRLFLALMSGFCLLVLIVDSEIILTFLEEVALFPLLIIWLSCYRVSRPLATDDSRPLTGDLATE